MTSKKTIEKSKLIQLLSTFSSLEWKRFGRFVQSPYHNSNQQLIDLYTILKKAFPFEVLKELEQERIYKKVYGQEKFKLSKFQNLCSDLYELAGDFIIDVHLDKEKRKKKKLLIDALSERNYELFKRENNKLVKEIETQRYFFDEDDFLLLYQLNNKLYHHIARDKFNVNQLELNDTWKNLNAFYDVTKTQLEAENRNKQNILTIIKKSEDTDYNQLKKLFQLATKLHTTKQTDLYFQLKKETLDNWNQLKRKDKTDLLVHLLNFSFINELIQKEFGHKEALNLYKLGIKDKLFVIDGKMRDIEFFNISMIGFKYESEEWVTNFIEVHKHYLPEKIRIFLVPLAYAYSAIFKNDYEQVINILKDINPSNNLVYLDKIKTLLIRAYFEAVIKENEAYRNPLHYEINSLKKMMERNEKLSSTKIESTNNFLTLTKKLLNLYDDKSIELKKNHSFEILLSQTNPLLLRQWLTEMFLVIKNATS